MKKDDIQADLNHWIVIAWAIHVYYSPVYIRTCWQVVVRFTWVMFVSHRSWPGMRSWGGCQVMLPHWTCHIASDFGMKLMPRFCSNTFEKELFAEIWCVPLKGVFSSFSLEMCYRAWWPKHTLSQSISGALQEFVSIPLIFSLSGRSAFCCHLHSEWCIIV